MAEHIGDPIAGEIEDYEPMNAAEGVNELESSEENSPTYLVGETPTKEEGIQEEPDDVLLTKKSFNIMVGMGTSKVIATLNTGATCNTIPYGLLMGCGYREIEQMKSHLFYGGWITQETSGDC